MAARNREAAEQRIEELAGQGLSAKWVYCDASVKESYASMAREVEASEGKIDILVNNLEPPIRRRIWTLRRQPMKTL